MESSTQVLRRLLDERGVEWTANDGEHVKETCWPYMGELTAAFAEYDNGTTRFACDTWCFTPEQAIEATLGRGTCRAISMRERDKRPYLHDELVCSECGCQLAHEFGHVWQRYCPNCGRRVEQ